MTARPTPRAAIWLLERLGGPSGFDPLIGDLAEQFAQGRSRVWFWRQTLGAVFIYAAGKLRAHGLSFLGAVLAGCALNTVLERCCSLTFAPVYENLAAVKRHPWSVDALLRLGGMLGNTLFWCVICCACAWLVTRVHRAHQRAVLLAFVVTLIAPRLPGITLLALNAGTDRNAAIALATRVILTGLDAIFMLVAGLWMIRTARAAQMSRWIRLVALLWIGQVLLASLLFAARRVGEIAYAQPEGYLGMYALAVTGGMYLALVLWPQPAPSPAT